MLGFILTDIEIEDVELADSFPSASALAKAVECNNASEATKILGAQSINRFEGLKVMPSKYTDDRPHLSIRQYK